MSQPGTNGPLKIRVSDAAIVGALIHERTLIDDLSGTPLAALPEFGRKLASAALRRRNARQQVITIWSLQGDLARAGFQFLSLFALVPEPELTEEERQAVQAMTPAIAAALKGRRRPNRMNRAARNHRVGSERNDESVIVDESWVRELKRRNDREDQLNATSVNALLQRLRRVWMFRCPRAQRR